MTARSAVDAIAAETDIWLPAIYRSFVRAQRTRAVSITVPAKENSPEIIFTLLGIELRVGRRRFVCPDLSTARYLSVFARIGCGDLAIPYDITRVSAAADKLETSWNQCVLRFEHLTSKFPMTAAKRARTSFVKRIRDEIADIGPGAMMPEFILPRRK